MLNAESLAGQSAVADADVKSYYEQNKGRYGTEEQRRASHILITPEGSDKAAARKKAEGILTTLKTNPGDFAKLRGSSQRTRVPRPRAEISVSSARA